MAIGFIGTGRMGSMLVRALLGADPPLEEEVWASNRSPDKLEELALHYPRLHMGENSDLAEQCTTLFLCVRPADTLRVVDEIAPRLKPTHLLITITNVVELDRLAAHVRCRVAKVIPSFAQFVRRGVTLVVPGPRSTAYDLNYLHDLLRRVSTIYQVTEEQTRAATNVVSCGPAFLARFCAEWVAAAHAMQPEIPIEDWDSMVWETVRAAAELPRAGIAGREILEEVSTPGGMTHEGLRAMDQVLPAMWADIMRRTADREKELKAALGL